MFYWKKKKKKEKKTVFKCLVIHIVWTEQNTAQYMYVATDESLFSDFYDKTCKSGRKKCRNATDPIYHFRTMQQTLLCQLFQIDVNMKTVR